MGAQLLAETEAPEMDLKAVAEGVAVGENTASSLGWWLCEEGGEWILPEREGEARAAAVVGEGEARREAAEIMREEVSAKSVREREAQRVG